MMNVAQIARRRLASLHLTGPGLSDTQQVVSSLCGVQSQDYAGAKWSIGLRMDQATDGNIEKAIADKKIVRTWAMRGTLHFVASADIYWLLEILAPGIIVGNARRYRQLELDEVVFARSNQVIEKTLLGGKQLTRAELMEELEANGISAAGQRAPYLLQRAALAGIICHGPYRKSEPTYTLLREWVPAGGVAGKTLGLAELAKRYFTSHGPATLQDFVWWSGLSASAARTALAEAGPNLARAEVDGKEFWSSGEHQLATEPSAHFLPPFDEYLLGYKDRTAAVKAEHTKRINAGGGMPKPTVILSGQVVGMWRQKTEANRLRVRVELFRELTAEEFNLLEAAAARLGVFWGKAVDLEYGER